MQGANSALVVGNGALVEHTVSGTGESVRLTGAANSKVTVETGGTIQNSSSSNSANAIYALSGTHNLTVTVEQGGSVLTGGGEAIAASNTADGSSPTGGAFAMEIINHGLIEHTNTGGDRLIHIYGGNVNNRAVVELENGGTLTNRGLIENLGTDAAIEGDEAGTDVETIVNSGTIKTAGATAINLFDGDDSLEVQAGSVITGNAVGGLGTDALRFGGTGSASFGLGDIGATQKFREFI